MIAAARAWVGTPFRHQAAARGAGCDCLGLIRGVATDLGISTLSDREWREVGGYGRLPRPDIMGAAMARHLTRIDGPGLPGDIAWIAWRNHRPMHLAFLAERDGRASIIHAYEGVGHVVEHGFVPPWPGRVHSWWAYPQLSGGRAA